MFRYILENIVNAVLEDLGFETVHNIQIMNPHNLPVSINLKESVLDVKAIINIYLRVNEA